MRLKNWIRKISLWTKNYQQKTIPIFIHNKETTVIWKMRNFPWIIRLPENCYKIYTANKLIEILTDINRTHKCQKKTIKYELQILKSCIHRKRNDELCLHVQQFWMEKKLMTMLSEENLRYMENVGSHWTVSFKKLISPDSSVTAYNSYISENL